MTNKECMEIVLRKQKERLSRFWFGDLVGSHTYLERKCVRSDYRGHGSNGGVYVDELAWRDVRFPDDAGHEGIYIGWRYLTDGKSFMRHDGHEYKPSWRHMVALVCFDPARNPVYVSADELQLISRGAVHMDTVVAGKQVEDEWSRSGCGLTTGGRAAADSR